MKLEEKVLHYPAATHAQQLCNREMTLLRNTQKKHDNLPDFLARVKLCAETFAILTYVNVVETINKVLRFEVFTAVTMKNDVFWDVTPRGSCKNRRFVGT
jgi:hypothetical protein